MIDELNVFLPKSKTAQLVDWLFSEIEALKSKRRVPTSKVESVSPKSKKKERKRDRDERGERKKKKKDRRDRTREVLKN